MTAFIMTVTILHILAVGVRICHMSRVYPRASTVDSVGEDLIMTLISVGFAAWGISIIF